MRHADAGGHALPKRAGGGLHAGGQAIFRMAGSFAVELAKTFDVVQRDGQLSHDFVVRITALTPREMQQAYRATWRRGHWRARNDHGSARWDSLDRSAAHVAISIGHRRERHRGSGMAGISLLDGVHRQSADGVDGKLVNVAGVLDVLTLFRDLGYREGTSHCPWNSFGG